MASKEKQAIKQNIVEKNMSFSEVLQKYPEAAPIMMKFGLHCIGCHAAAFETIEQGCRAHGIQEENIKKMVEEINRKTRKFK